MYSNLLKSCWNAGFWGGPEGVALRLAIFQPLDLFCYHSTLPPGRTGATITVNPAPARPQPLHAGLL